jgi:hypothetical protein
VATVFQEVTRVVNLEVERPAKEVLVAIIISEYINHPRSGNDIFTAGFTNVLTNSFQPLPLKPQGPITAREHRVLGSEQPLFN